MHMAQRHPPEEIPANMLDMLPLEIWEQVFLQTLSTPSYFKPAGFNITDFVEFDPKSVLALSQISRYVRQVVISCPILWTYLPSLKELYCVPDELVYSQSSVDLVNLFVERAKNLPLHVTLVEDHEIWPSQTSQGQNGGHKSSAGIASFFPTSDRWKSLTILFTTEKSLVKYARHLGSHSLSYPNLLPTLDTLAIQQRKTSMTYLPNPISIFLSAARLKHIHFIGMDIDTLFVLPWNQIKSYNGAVQQFTLLGAAANTVEELVLKRNLQHFLNPTIDMPFYFTRMTRLKFDNINFKYALPVYYGDWRDDGTVLRWIKAPVLQSLEITMYQALIQAPSIISDLTMAMLHYPHDNLRHITFHVGGLTRQSLVDLLQSTPNLDTLDLWGAPNEALSALKVYAGEGMIRITGMVLVPKLRQLVIREWQDTDARTLLEIFDSRKSNIANSAGISSLESISLVYQKYAGCRDAQDSIEGWGEERAKLYTPRSEYHKIHGYSTHLAKTFLLKDSKRNPHFYGLHHRKRLRSCNGDPLRFIERVGKHDYCDLRFVEISRLRDVLEDIRDQLKEEITDESPLPLPDTAYVRITDESLQLRTPGPADVEVMTLLLQTADTLLQKWGPYFSDKDMARRWKLSEDFLTWKLDS